MYNKNAGLTLVELLLSITVIGIIVISFIPLFTVSAKTNLMAETTLDSTYLGKDAMEVIYKLCRSIEYEDLDAFKNELGEQLEDRGYYEDTSWGGDSFNYIYKDNRYLTVNLDEEGDLIRAMVRIYVDESMNELEVQFESLYARLGRGILSE